MSRANLTRGEADDLISDCTTLEGLLDLQQHWIGHRDIAPGDKRGHVRAVLYEYVASCAEARQDRRRSGRNPSPHDRTGLTAPRGQNPAYAPKVEVRGAIGHETLRGVYWSGALYADGRPVLRFENQGNGGCLELDWRPHMSEPQRAAIIAATIAAAKVKPEAFEAFDIALGVLWDNAIMRSK